MPDCITLKWYLQNRVERIKVKSGPVPGPRADYQQLSDLERSKIELDIRGDLVEHFCRSTRSGIIAGGLSSCVAFALLFSHTNLTYLLSWFGALSLIHGLALLLDLAYKRQAFMWTRERWAIAYEGLSVACTVFWGLGFFLSLQDFSHQIASLAFLCVIASSFATATVGVFSLCVISVGFILVPAAGWFLLQRSFYYEWGALFIILYYIFLLGMNKRSTQWFIESLKLSKMLASFTHQANHDLLTDLPNQRLLIHMVEAAIHRAEETQRNFGIIALGINRLEVFNNLGYQTGDLIVQALSKRLKVFFDELNVQNEGSFHYTLTLPRPYAFTILMEPMTPESIKVLSEQLFTLLDAPFSLGKRETKITISLGAAWYTQDDDFRTILSHAYESMFQAKLRGGNQLEVYEAQSHHNTPISIELENDLYRAVERKELLVYYQPIIDLMSGKVSGMEALVRWKHPTRGMISPMDFIPLAEETGMINAIGEWVLEEACRQTMEWRRQGFHLTVAVNLSAKQFWKGNLPEVISKILDKTEMLPQFLELELTETQILDKKLIPLIKEITSKNIILSIDDFGTGYSGLTYLKFFNVGKIKIDKSFIDDVNTNDNSATIVCAILDMAKAMNIKTLAEGVETQEQLEFLREKGCRFIQGYYFSKPLSAEDFMFYLKHKC